MLRKQFKQRPNWVDECKRVGFDFCDLPSQDGSWYWSEGVGYELTLKQVDHLDDATNELHAMCMSALRDIIASGDYPVEFGLSDVAKVLVEQSWNREDKHLYGRFDLAYDGNVIKMLEYNADTPTSLLEASVVQWDWVMQTEGIPNRDQFNSIHEKLIERWGIVGQSIAMQPRVHFCATKEAGREDWGNLEYLMDTATQAGIDVSELAIENIGWNGTGFTDLENRPIIGAFKLYAWEWMTNTATDEYGANLLKAGTRWVEPPWKMILSNKAILPILWRRNEGHPLLLPAHYDNGMKPMSGRWVRKPILAREGANVTLLENGQTTTLTGSEFNTEYDKSGYVLQQWVDLPLNDGFRPLVGSWIIGDQAAGIGIREDVNVVTGNDSHFIPHYFVE